MAETLQQTQTLSLRMSEALRKRLEDIRKLTAVKRGESVSTSEIAKQLLESAREERTAGRGEISVNYLLTLLERHVESRNRATNQ